MTSQSNGNEAIAASPATGARQTLDQQLAMIESLARQHYPGDEMGQHLYTIKLLTQRLREYEAMRLSVRYMSAGHDGAGGVVLR